MIGKILILLAVLTPHTLLIGAFSINRLLPTITNQEESTLDVSTSYTSLPPTYSTRRKLISYFFGTAAPSLLLVGGIDKASASCLTGDESPECIGVFKEGIPESNSNTIAQSYGVFRPNQSTITLPNPTSLNEAIGMLKDQLIAIEDVEEQISSASFELAGTTMLRVLPRLIIAERYIATELPSAIDRADEITVLGLVVDKNLGKAMRGNLGGTAVVVVAQLELLSNVKVLKTSLDGLIARATA